MSGNADGSTLKIEVAGVPYPLEFGDWVDDRFWSTCQFATNQSTPVTTLAAGYGDTLPGGTGTLNIRQSNLTQGAGRGMQDGYEMLVFSIQHIIGSNMPPAGKTAIILDDILEKTVFAFYVQNKKKHEGPLYKMPSGSGQYDPQATQGSNNGVPSPRDQSAFVLPIELRPNVAFKGEFQFSAALAALTTGSVFNIETHLQGLVKKPVT